MRRQNGHIQEPAGPGSRHSYRHGNIHVPINNGGAFALSALTVQKDRVRGRSATCQATQRRPTVRYHQSAGQSRSGPVVERECEWDGSHQAQRAYTIAYKATTKTIYGVLFSGTCWLTTDRSKRLSLRKSAPRCGRRTLINLMCLKSKGLDIFIWS